MNGGLNFSPGRLVGRGLRRREGLRHRQRRDPRRREVQDGRDADALFGVLEEKVVPLYYQRDERGIPRAWLGRVKTALARLGYRYNSDRMVADYATLLYAPAAGTVSAEIRS